MNIEKKYIEIEPYTKLRNLNMEILKILNVFSKGFSTENTYEYKDTLSMYTTENKSKRNNDINVVVNTTEYKLFALKTNKKIANERSNKEINIIFSPQFVLLNFTLKSAFCQPKP